MPVPAYLTIHGTYQGLISAGALGAESAGAGRQSGFEDQILVQAINHGIVVPGGVKAGRRKHQPFIVTKALDKSSPLLNIALCNAEILSCRVAFYRPAAEGAGLEHFYSLELKDAIIKGIEFVMPHCQELTTAHFTQLERVHFAYRHITWRHEIGHTMGYDEWQEGSPS